jgi:hypothetical protein
MRRNQRAIARTLAVEGLEPRTLLAALTWEVQSDYFGTQLPASQPRSLRGLALSGDESSIYGGFTQGSTSRAIRKVSSDVVPGIIGNAPPHTSAVEARVDTFPGQAKGLATDDRGYVYATLNSGFGGISQPWAIYSSSLSILTTQISISPVASQLGGISVQKFDPDGPGGDDPTYYAYLSHNQGNGQIERWDVTNPALPVLDLTWGGGDGSIDLQAEYGPSAFANGLEVDDDGTLYVTGGILSSGFGDSVFKIPADGNLDQAIRVSVNGAMDVALFDGKAYVTQYLAASSSIAVLSQADLALLETLIAAPTNGQPGSYDNSEDSGYSGIGISADGRIYLVEQLYERVTSAETYTPPGGTPITGATILFDRILVSSAIETAPNAAPELGEPTSDSADCCYVAAGSPVTVTAPFTDADASDTHTATIDWGDGTITPATVTESGGSGTISGSHVYATGGIFNVTVTISDEDAETDVATTTATVAGVGLQGGQLQIVGTKGTDAVLVTKIGGSRKTGPERIKVVALLDLPKWNGKFNEGPGAYVQSFDPADVDSILILLCDGNDHATIADGGAVGGANLNLPALIDGGSGKDHLRGGHGDDTLLGGPGDDKLDGRGGSDVLSGGDDRDQLLGGNGRDVLIGGSGIDDLQGGAADDLLVGGYTLYDDDPDSLDLLRREWNSNNSYPTRQSNIRQGQGAILVGMGVRLQAASGGDGRTVFDDGAKDTLKGDAGRDWYFADLDGATADNDKIKDKKSDEQVEQILD